jgi:short subunit dehydrogenase-like uncharacterized protein
MLLIYGATGYTGGLIARIAVEKDLPVIIAGRTEARLQPLATQLGIDYRVFSLEAPYLNGVTILLNCAGPFSRSSSPLVEACLESGVHYLDITGEVDEIELVRAYHEQAQSGGVMLMPSVGFGVVPTDCLAAHVAQRLPAATHLAIAFETVGGVSQGTLSTLFGSLHTDGYLRQAGKLVSARPAQKSRTINFGQGDKKAVLNPWRGDLVTAYHSTSILNIETYTAFPAPVRFLMGAGWLHGLWGSTAVQNLLGTLFKRLPPGPSEKVLNEGATYVWAEARNDHETVTSRLVGPEAYRFTALTASAVAAQILDGKFEAGFHSPAQVYGADFVLQIEGVERVDVP